MIDPSPIPPMLLTGARDEAKAYLRLDTSSDDALIDQLLIQATALAEAFCGQRLVQRSFVERLAADPNWTRLSASPVRVFSLIESLANDGSATLLPGDAYGLDIDASGDGWVRLIRRPVSSAPARLRVTGEAGLARNWASLPDTVRLGILRLAAHFYTHRDANEDAGPPAAVAALLRPWRRLRLS